MNHLPIINRAELHSDRPALRSAGRQTTYRRLLDRSLDVAACLLDGRRDLEEARIAFLLPAGEDYVAVQWGIWRAGGIAVPLSLSAGEAELHYALADSQTACVVTTAELGSRTAASVDRLGLRTIAVESIDAASKGRLPQVDPGRRAMILYTSGTTSKPKGVVTTHACIEAQIRSLVEAWHWQPEDRIPLFLPLHHIHGIINVMACALWSGAVIEPFPKFDTESILRRVADDAYSLFMAVPTIYVKLIEALEAMPETERTPILQGFSRMRLMVSGSAALPASVHQQWAALTGQPLLERYGMTEIGMALSNPYHGERRPGTVGQPLPGVEVRLVREDENAGSARVEGEPQPGEIQVRGKTVFLEYWNRGEATRESFQDGWFRTGDIAVLEDGYYRIMGRSSIDIIKSGGYKLSALEIEAALLDHPAIGQCAVVGIPDATWGETVAAAVVLRSGRSLDLESLRGWCRGKISNYKIPHLLQTVDELPRNAMGKVVKADIAKLFSQART